MEQAAADLRGKWQAMEEGGGGALGKGNRYYEVDRGYDKGVYENDAANYLKIVGAFAIFYTCNILHFWGVFELGIRDSEAATMYQVVIFVFTLVVGAAMLISGRASTEIKNQADFLSEIIDRQKQ